MPKSTFQESQRFNQWWIWLIVILILGVSVYGSIQQGIGSAKDFLLSYGVLILVVLLFVSINLKTRINEEGIYLKMFPFHFSYVSYRWSEIDQVEVVEYNPVKDYGGWGVRYGSGGKAFNVKGNKGIKIHLKSGAVRMIGTQKVEAAKEAIKNTKPYLG